MKLPSRSSCPGWQLRVAQWKPWPKIKPACLNRVVFCVRQVAYRERQEEEGGGDPHATYSYVAAEAAAKAAGSEMGSEVPSLCPRHAVDLVEWEVG
jgi:hypothetical protein